MNNEESIAPINEDLNVEKYGVENIKNLIYNIRGKQVMLDSDVAKLYHYETRRINEAVRRNVERFPEDFCFKLTNEEYAILKSQFATSNVKETIHMRGGKQKIPVVFTEKGIIMLSGLLKSEIAVEVSVKIVEAFIRMRNFIKNNRNLFERVITIENKIDNKFNDYDNKFEEIFNQLQHDDNFKQKIFFEGQIYDAFSLFIDIIRKAEREIILIDGYVDIETLNILSKKNSSVNVKIYTKQNTRLSSRDINKFNLQYPKLEIKYTDKFHDRFLIIDQRIIYHIGASIKDAGKKCFGITLIKYDAIIKDILEKIK